MFQDRYLVGLLLNQIPTAVTIIFTLQMRKLRPRNAKWLTQNCTGSPWRRELGPQVLAFICSNMLWKFKLSKLN